MAKTELIFILFITKTKSHERHELFSFFPTNVTGEQGKTGKHDVAGRFIYVFK